MIEPSLPATPLTSLATPPACRRRSPGRPTWGHRARHDLRLHPERPAHLAAQAFGATAARDSCRASSTRAFLVLHLGLGICAEPDDGDAADQLRQTLLQLLAIVVRLGALDLGADLLHDLWMIAQGKAV